MQRVLVTGGAGFIGSAFLNRIVPLFPGVRFLCLDALTYAANPLNLADLRRHDNFRLQHVDLVDEEAAEWVRQFEPEGVVHLAAETHVDRSIREPLAHVRANVEATFHLLEVCRRLEPMPRFVHVSTDEVFGALGPEGRFQEDTRYDPSSPYSATKAAADHLVRAWRRTYGLPTMVTHCSNNFGPRQFPEKLIPLTILNAVEGKPLPVYGEGKQVRDWLFVDDHVEGLWLALTQGVPGETYCFGGEYDVPNLQVVQAICAEVGRQTGRTGLEGLVTFVPDRPGHDFRYAIDPAKAIRELGWTRQETFGSGLAKTVAWYLANPLWVESVRTGAYRDWMRVQYGEGLA